jgi:hypothetical protein
MSYALTVALVEAVEAIVGIDYTSKTGVQTTDDFIARLRAARDRAAELWKVPDGTS